MKHRFVILIFVAFATAISTSAQSRVVTNADLQIYKQKRVKADAEYRQNYAELGFSSVEEFDRNREARRLESEERLVKLRNEMIDRERLDFERRRIEETTYQYYPSGGTAFPNYYSLPLIYLGYGARYRPHFRRNGHQQGGYFGGGRFWPLGGRSRPQPLILRPRLRGR